MLPGRMAHLTLDGSRVLPCFLCLALNVAFQGYMPNVSPYEYAAQDAYTKRTPASPILQPLVSDLFLGRDSW